MSIDQALPTTAERPASIDYRAIFDRIRSSSLTVPILLFAAAFCFTFWPLLVVLPNLWFGKDSYYSHGILVPVLSGTVVARNWDRLSKLPIRWGIGGLIGLVLTLPVTYVARIAQTQSIYSVCLILTIFFTVWFVAGWRWARAVSLPIGFLAFALPLWTMAIDIYTNPLQILSTKVAFVILSTFGFNPYQPDPTTILLNRFPLNVAVPCSGLKLLLAVTAFTIYFVMIGGLKFSRNLAMFAFVLPLCLFINGLRISMIGMVGDTYGDEAGHQFHDYSGYIGLVLCFFILFRFARMLGWKN